MSATSQWPLPHEGIRFIVPEFIVQQLAEHPLTKDCFPVAMGYYPKAFGHRMQRLQHSDHLIIYCTEGGGSVQVGSSKLVINAGDLLILPKDQSHSYQASGKKPWSIYWLHFTGLLSKNFLEGLLPNEQTFVSLSVGVQARIIADFENLLEVRRTGYNPRNFIHASNLLKQLLTYLSAIYPLSSVRQRLRFDLDAVHAMMQENLHGQLSLEALANKVNLSKYHFSKRYKLLTGQSPIQYFLHLKMEQACYLLDLSGNSVKEISRNLGYEDNYYFSRLFKKIIGVSPRQYRQLGRG